MRTKIAKVPVPAVESEDIDEPTDAELQAIEDSEEGEPLAGPLVTAAGIGGATPIDLARLGLNQLAYVRRAVVDAQPIWSIHSAMGHPLGAAPTLEQAWGAIVQNDLQPVFVH